MSLSQQELLNLARPAAEARVTKLRTELDALYKSFPDLRNQLVPNPAKATRIKPPRQRKTSWSAAQRKAAANRMKKYWAARKAGKKK